MSKSNRRVKGLGEVSIQVRDHIRLTPYKRHNTITVSVHRKPTCKSVTLRGFKPRRDR